MTYKYDNNNIFAKIISGNLQAKYFLKHEEFIVIYDINPQDNTHLLFIPKIEAVNLVHLLEMEEKHLNNFYNNLSFFLKSLNKYGIENYRIIINNGAKSMQLIFHLHVHIISNDFLSNYLSK